MNTEQVKKHKEVIKWFCDNSEKGVWVQHKGFYNWQLDYEPMWFPDAVYVQNDEYSKLRKWLADGKEVQFRSVQSLDKWETIYSNPTAVFYHGMENYRIKPNEPAFKIGDWVIDDEGKIEQVINTSQHTLMATSSKYNRPHRVFKLWTPAEGEWCVFWDYDSNSYVVGVYEKLYSDGRYIVANSTLMYSNIAPIEFIATLKDK